MKALREAAQGDTEFLVTIVEQFLQDSQGRFAQLRETLKRAEADAIMRDAHGIKSSMLTLHADALAVLAEELEMNARSNDLSRAETLFAAMTGEYGRVESFLREQVLADRAAH